MEIKLGFSTCPNDTFIFDALVNNRIDTEGINFNLVLADIKELNSMAFDQVLDITKLSYHSYAYIIEDYVLLNAGSALGNNCGPLVISKEALNEEALLQKGIQVAIPGKYTTANFLLSMAFPNLSHKKEMLFNEIEQSVLSGESDFGLIIHENRFTYKEKGLHKIMDLGEYWEQTFSQPIPLGGIVAKRSLGNKIIKRIDGLIKKSIEYAFLNPSASSSFIKKYAQEMEETVIQQHIDLYVNEYSIDLGIKGKAAIQMMFDIGREKKIIPAHSKSIFIDKQFLLDENKT